MTTTTAPPFAGLEDKQADRNRHNRPPGTHIAQLVREGATVPELAARYGCANQRIWEAMREAGYTSKGEKAAKQPPRITTEPRTLLPLLEDVDPPCKGLHHLFESTDRIDHVKARAICDGCPGRLFLACEKLTGEEKNHDGTWAGVLYIDGRPLSQGPRQGWAPPQERGGLLMPTEWTRQGDPVPRYAPCVTCGVTTIGSTTWWNRTQQGRDELRRQGIVQRRRNGMCRKCFERGDRRRITATEPAPTRTVSADELLDEWHMLADPNLSNAENCRRLAPRLGMRWRSMERALKRARARERAA